jgi:hypothetical protein
MDVTWSYATPELGVRAVDGHLSEKALALIGNASGQGAEEARNCSAVFSIRRLTTIHPSGKYPLGN